MRLLSLTNSPALLLKERHTSLIISDLHIGFEKEMRSKGIFVPPQTHKIVDRLGYLIKKYSVKFLYILGDVKHDFIGFSRSEWHQVMSFFKDVKNMVDDIFVLPGNHDGELRERVSEYAKILPSKGIMVNYRRKFWLFHGHTKPPETFLDADCVIMGHTHPIVKIIDEGSFVKKQVLLMLSSSKVEILSKLFKTRKGTYINPKKLPKLMRLIIMPSFNDMLAGVSINDPSEKVPMGPILRSNAFNLELSEVYLLDGTYLGILKDLKRIYEKFVVADG